MTGAELIKSLADDLDIPRARAEDILLALRDLCVAEITAGRSFVFPGIGQIQRRRDSKGPRFRSAVELKQMLGLVVDGRDRPFTDNDLCETCKKKPRQDGRRKCGSCRGKQIRAKSKKAGR